MAKGIVHCSRFSLVFEAIKAVSPLTISLARVRVVLVGSRQAVGPGPPAAETITTTAIWSKQNAAMPTGSCEKALRENTRGKFRAGRYGFYFTYVLT